MYANQSDAGGYLNPPTPFLCSWYLKGSIRANLAHQSIHPLMPLSFGLEHGIQHIGGSQTLVVIFFT